MEGPQLLYICRGHGLHGLWEPVLGPAPGPDVKLHQEVAVRLNGDASTQSFLLLPGIGSIVLDFLFNYTFANWRGGFSFSGIWGLEFFGSHPLCSAPMEKHASLQLRVSDMAGYFAALQRLDKDVPPRNADSRAFGGVVGRQ